jgi:phage shock protein C
MKRLVRPRSGRQIAGVCEGLGIYFGVDPTIVRLIFLVLTFTGGPGLILYIILALIVPEGDY